MASRACADITGTGKRVAAVLWNSLSYSMIQITRRKRPARTVISQTNKAAIVIWISSLTPKRAYWGFSPHLDDCELLVEWSGAGSDRRPSVSGRVATRRPCRVHTSFCVLGGLRAGAFG